MSCALDIHFPVRSVFLVLAFFFCIGQSVPGQTGELAREVTIRRTTYGVPHIIGENLRAVAFGLAYAEMEDYGERVIRPLLGARGDLALVDGYEALTSDLINQLGYERTVATYHLLSQDTRDLLEGFAAGVNHYLVRYPDSFPQYHNFSFSGYDVAAVTTSMVVPQQGARFAQRLRAEKNRRDSIAAANGAGSNAWAFAPERTVGGNAILVRNPHLSWSAGYYEAHLTVPGKLNFYGDFRIGGLFAIIGGFNDRLGWSTTNNSPDLDEYYALEADPVRVDHFLIDGVSVPLIRKLVTAEFRNGAAVATETREFWFTPYGPVIHRDEGKIYILKAAGDGEYRRGEQFTRMMLARNLEEWKAAMRMQAITSSNYTYADADGNIFYVWNAAIPDLPLPSGGDTLAVPLVRSSDVWSRAIPFDSLPQLHNPPGGYLHNENDPFHFTNLNAILRPEDFPDYFPRPRLRQRSQHSLLLIDQTDPLTLEQVVALKHSMRMLVADQMKDDLLEALKASRLPREQRKAVEHLEAWDNSVAADSRGGILFERWLEKYQAAMRGKELFSVPWSFDDPMATPRGIAEEEVAVAAFGEALAELTEQYGTWDLAWGDLHRLRLGDLDLPIGGGPGGLGCFRVLWFAEDEDGKRRIRGGDGWQFAVEFSDPPRAYSILAYGQTNNPRDPRHTAQAQLFAENKMKPVAFTEAAIRQALVSAYHPGEER